MAQGAAGAPLGPATEDLPAQPLERLLDLEVSAVSKFPQRLSDSPAAATVITGAQIRALGYRTLADVLRSVRGVFVSSDRAYAYLGVRGSAAPGDYNTRILLLIDGNRVNDSVYDQAPLGSEFPVDLDLVERVEFVPGQGSAVHGANALFGIVNVITRHAAVAGGSEAAASVGSAGARGLRLTRTWVGADGGSLLLSASGRRSDGEDPYYPAFDDPPRSDGVSRGTDDERGEQLFAKFGRGGLVATLLHADRRHGLSGEGALVFGDPRNQYRDIQTLASVSWEQPVAEATRWTLRAYGGEYDFRGDYVMDGPSPTLNHDRVPRRRRARRGRCHRPATERLEARLRRPHGAGAARPTATEREAAAPRAGDPRMTLPTPAARRRDHRPRPLLGPRVTRAVVLSSAAALLLSGLILDVFVYVSLRATLVEDATVQARITAENSSAAIVFDDREVAAATLAGLQASPLVRHAELLAVDGTTIARYDAPGAPPEAAPPRVPGGAGHRFTDDALLVEAPVRERGRTVGTLRLAASLAPLHARVGLYVLMTAGGGALALGLAWLLVIRLRREVEATERRLDYLAFFDPVTGLRNRHAAVEALTQRIARRGGAEAEPFAVMLLDLDDFKDVNDTLGHAAGDAVLRQVAERLAKYVQPAEHVFRFGGDEFLVIAPRLDELPQLRLLGQSALVALEEPLRIAGQELHARVSVGIARFGVDASDGVGLIRAADTAMYAAKALGKNTLEIFRAEMERSAKTRLRLDHDLRRAIERHELRLVYQPIVDACGQRLAGVEALLRWDHPELGPVSPAEFIPIAESSGQIVEIGRWVLESACRQAKAWADAGPEALFVAVNVSARQIRRGLAEPVQAALAASGVEARQLEIEITEHSMVEDLASNVAQLSRLRELGLQVAVDDFGTGLSSLAYLKRLPISKLKIDRAFVKDLPHNPDDAAIVQAIVSMARSLHLSVVAEGVETEAQRDFLAAQGIRLFQGYLYSRPLPSEALDALLRRQALGERPWGEQPAAEGARAGLPEAAGLRRAA